VNYQKGGDIPVVEETVVGDSIFNNEDRAGQVNASRDVHNTDVPSYATVPGTGTQTTSGRLPNYPDAGQGQRWARFEENLRRERPRIVGRCSVCEEFQNRRREDVA
jgi:hypothetical protein